MDAPVPFSLPEKAQNRDVIFGIRLTLHEREAVKNLARQIKIPASEMARHFMLQAVAYHSARLAEKSGADAPNS